MPVLMFVLALLMISRLRFPKAKVRKSKAFNAFQILTIAGVYYCGITRSWPEYLFGMAVFLLIAGIIAGRVSRDS
jgi:phosphatidylserine synthase